MAAGTDLDRLADFVTSQRVELSMDVEELALRMGVSDKTVRRIETGKSVSRDTYAKLERELGWTAGSARHAREGGFPQLKQEQAGALASADVAAEADRLVEAIRGVLRLQGKKMTPRMTAVFLDELGSQITSGKDGDDPEATERDHSP